MDFHNSQYTTTALPTNKKDMTLEVWNYTKMVGMFTLKHEISLTKFYEILLKT